LGFIGAGAEPFEKLALNKEANLAREHAKGRRGSVVLFEDFGQDAQRAGQIAVGECVDEAKDGCGLLELADAPDGFNRFVSR
jgi:hypothetical protein